VFNLPKSARIVAALTVALPTIKFAYAQAAAGSAVPDVLVLVDGEKLIGHLEQANGTTLTFKSDLAGEITVDWSKVQELRSLGRYAVIEKGTRIRWQKLPPSVAQGTLTVSAGKLEVQRPAAAPPISLPFSDVQNVVSAEAFERAVESRPGLFSDWKGSATAGVSIVAATENERTYTSSISLARTIPTESWISPSSRTAIDFTSSYGRLTQPGHPSVETSILHAQAERDQYFSPKLFVFAEANFDHNYAQGLDLQQTYGGGAGWTAIQNAFEELDFKAELTYSRQQFQVASSNQNLVGSIFSESYDRKLVHEVALHEQAGYQPAWNNTAAFAAFGNLTITLPVYKRLGGSVSILDNFLNDPPPGFQKNSFTFTTGATYTLP
jgi:hypothetical protein